MTSSICLFLSCDKNESERQGDWTVSQTVNEIKLDALISTKDAGFYGKESSLYAEESAGVIVFQDYNNMYRLYVMSGELCLLHLYRFEGRLTFNLYDSNMPRSAGIIDVGVVSNISEIEGDCAELTCASVYHQTFQPNHGYSVCFVDENAKQYDMAIYAKSYTLDNDGKLKSVTIQYKLIE